MSQQRFSISSSQPSNSLRARVAHTTRRVGRVLALVVLLSCAGGMAPSGGDPYSPYDGGSATVDPAPPGVRTFLEPSSALADGRPEPLPSTPQFHITESPLASTSHRAGRRDIAWTEGGELYVVEEGRNAVMRFDAQVRPIDRWGGSGRAAGRFDLPHAIEVAPNGSVWVLDAGGRLQAFDPFGLFLRQLAVGPEVLDFVILEDGHLNLVLVGGRVRRIDAEGHRLGEWAIEGGAPLAAAGSPGHGLWFLSADGRRILQYDRDGALLGERTVDTVDEELPRNPSPVIAVGPAGELAVYVAGRDVHVSWAPGAPFEAIRAFGARGMDFDPDGRLWLSVGSSHGMTIIDRDSAQAPDAPWYERIQAIAVPRFEGDGEPVRDAAVDHDHMLLALHAAGFGQYDRFGRRLSSWRDPSLPLDDAAAAEDARGYGRIAVAPDGTRWLSAPDRLVGVSPSGLLISELRWLDLLDSEVTVGEAVAPAIAVARDGSLFAADAGRGLLVRLGPAGATVETWGHPVLQGLVAPQMSILDGGDLALMAGDRSGVLRFAQDGRRLSSWPLPSDALPTAITARPGGGVLIAESARPSLLGLSAEGRLLFRRTSGAQSSAGPLSSPIHALTVEPSPTGDTGAGPGGETTVGRSLFAVAGDEIARATADGRLLQVWQSDGFGMGMVWDIGGIAWTADETLFVTARSGRVVYRYDRHGHLIDHWPVNAAPMPLELGRSYDAGRSVAGAARLASQPARYSGIDVGPEGQVCVVEPSAGAVLCFDPDGRMIEQIGTSSPKGEPFRFPGYGFAGDVAFGRTGRLWIVESDRVSAIDPDGRVVETSFAESESQGRPGGIVEAENGDVYLSTDSAVHRYGPEGRLQQILHPHPVGGAQRFGEGLAIQGNVLDVVTSDAIQRLSPEGDLVGTWAENAGRWLRDVSWSAKGWAAVSTASGIGVFSPPEDASWNAAYAAHRWSLDGPIWRTGVAAPRLPGPTPPYGDAIRDPAWRFRRLVRRDGEPARRWRIQAAGHVRLRAGEALLLDAYSAEPATYEGAMSFGLRGTLVELEYASRGGTESLDFEWLPWEEVGRVYLPVVGR